VCFGSPLCSLVLLLVRFVASLSLGFACLPQTPRFGVVWLVSLVLLASSALGGAFFLRRHLPRDHCRSDRVKSKYVLICSSWENAFTTPPRGETKEHTTEGKVHCSFGLWPSRVSYGRASVGSACRTRVPPSVTSLALPAGKRPAWVRVKRTGATGVPVSLWFLTLVVFGFVAGQGCTACLWFPHSRVFCSAIQCKNHLPTVFLVIRFLPAWGPAAHFSPFREAETQCPGDYGRNPLPSKPRL